MLILTLSPELDNMELTTTSDHGATARNWTCRRVFYGVKCAQNTDNLRTLPDEPRNVHLHHNDIFMCVVANLHAFNRDDVC